MDMVSPFICTLRRRREDSTTTYRSLSRALADLNVRHSHPPTPTDFQDVRAFNTDPNDPPATSIPMLWPHQLHDDPHSPLLVNPGTRNGPLATPKDRHDGYDHDSRAMGEERGRTKGWQGVESEVSVGDADHAGQRGLMSQGYRANEGA